MQPVESGINSEVSVPDVASLEASLAEMLGKTAREVDHVECFDQEQRAEIYAILQALQSDTNVHRGMVETLLKKLSQKAAYA